MLPVLIFIAGVWVNPANIVFLEPVSRGCLIAITDTRLIGQAIKYPGTCDEAAKEINEKVKQ